MKKIADNILKNKNLEESLGAFANQMMDIYSEYSYVRFSLNFYSFCEMVKELPEKSQHLSTLLAEFFSITQKGVIENAAGDDWEILVKRTDALRQRVIDVMKGLTAYVDVFNIYEYCLNRIEYRFVEPDFDFDYDDVSLSANILRYILSDKDNVVINSRISEVVRQLPVRMTKNKFFELLTEGIKVYKGSEEKSVDDFLYILKTCAMLEVSENIALLDDDLSEIYNEFKNTNFNSLNKDDFYSLRSKLDFAVSYITSQINIYMLIGELINDMYVILLATPYVMDEGRYSKNAVEIIKDIKIQFDNENVNLEEEISDKYIFMEGVQERLYAKFSAYEYLIDSVSNEHSGLLQSLMLEKVYNSLNRISKLESGSIFVEFDIVKSKPADENYIKKVTENLVDEIRSFFENHERIINRAVMASVLSSLPVFFGNAEAIQDYVTNSLCQCSDKAEKTAVIEIITQMMDDDGYEMV